MDMCTQLEYSNLNSPCFMRYIGLMIHCLHHTDDKEGGSNENPEILPQLTLEVPNFLHIGHIYPTLAPKGLKT